MSDGRHWTFMVYLAGDNNLETYGTHDLHEMKAVGSSDELSIVAQFDKMSDQVTRRYHLTDSESLEDDCLVELPEVNSGDPQALIDFITWATTHYPAERYALVLWNHGAGWKDDDVYKAADLKGLRERVGRGQIRGLTSGKPSRALFWPTLVQMVEEATLRAVLFDDSSADFLDNLEMKRVLQQTTADLRCRLDLLGFDACLMSMLEVHYQIKDTCQVAVGSQEIEPGDGWPYDTILSRLAAEPGMGPEDLAAIIVEEYVRCYRVAYPALPITQSAVRLSAIEAVAAAVSDLGEVLIAHLSDQRIEDRIFDALRFSQTFKDQDYVDLRHFCQLLAARDKGSPVSAAAQAVVDLLAGPASPVIAEAHHGPAVDDASGMSIYLTTRVLSPLYTKLDFARYRWDEFLSELVKP